MFYMQLYYLQIGALMQLLQDLPLWNNKVQSGNKETEQFTPHWIDKLTDYQCTFTLPEPKYLQIFPWIAI